MESNCEAADPLCYYHARQEGLPICAACEAWLDRKMRSPVLPWDAATRARLLARVIAYLEVAAMPAEVQPPGDGRRQTHPAR